MGFRLRVITKEWTLLKKTLCNTSRTSKQKILCHFCMFMSPYLRTILQRDWTKFGLSHAFLREHHTPILKKRHKLNEDSTNDLVYIDQSIRFGRESVMLVKSAGEDGSVRTQTAQARCINYREYRYKVFKSFVICKTVSKLTVIYVPSLGGLWLGLSLHLSPFWANGSVKKCARLWRTRQFYRRGMLGAHIGQVSQLYMRSSGM